MGRMSQLSRKAWEVLPQGQMPRLLYSRQKISHATYVQWNKQGLSQIDPFPSQCLVRESAKIQDSES